MNKLKHILEKIFLNYLTYHYYVITTPILSILALIYWIIRYTIPSLKIIKYDGIAIYKHKEKIKFFGKNYFIRDVLSFAVEKYFLKYNLYIVLEKGLVFGGSRIFIKEISAR